MFLHEFGLATICNTRAHTHTLVSIKVDALQQNVRKHYDIGAAGMKSGSRHLEIGDVDLERLVSVLRKYGKVSISSRTHKTTI